MTISKANIIAGSTKFFTSTKGSLFSNTVYQLIGKALSMTITVFTTIVIARYYGRASFGEFNLMQAWPAFVFIIVDFGLNAIASREISKDWANAEKYFNTVLVLRIVLSAFFMAVIALALYFFDYDPMLKQGIRLNLLLILTQALFTTTNIIFQPKLRYDMSTIGYSVGYIFILVSVYISTKLHMPIAIVSFSYVIGGIITFIINAGYIERLGVYINLKRYDRDFSRYLIYQSLPLGLMFVFSQINFKSDTLLMSVLSTPSNLHLTKTESVALYSLAYKIFEVALVLPTFFMNSAYPILIKHMQEGKTKLTSTFTFVIKYLLIGGLLVGFIGAILSPILIKFIGGAEFTESIFTLQILMGGLVLYYLTQPLSWLIVTLDRQKYLPRIYFISALFNVTANYLFIPKYSFYASAVITHLSELLILLLLIFYLRKSWNEKFNES